MTLGNGMISGMQRGIEENFRDGFCGRIFIVSTNINNKNSVFMGEMQSMNPLQKMDKVVSELNNEFEKRGIDGLAVDWKKGTYPISNYEFFIRIILNVFVGFLFFVAVIIIMNTLAMAMLERTSEIGMMKAIGASSSFISRMFFLETFITSFLFGGAGIVLGIATTYIITFLDIKTTNEFMQFLFGGKALRPLLSLIDILNTFIQLLVVTLLSVIYPLGVVNRITPKDVVTRE